RVRGEGPPTEISPGSAVELFKGSTSLNLEVTISGAKLGIGCTGIGTLAGKVENPTGGGPGTAKLGLGFGGCSVTTPEWKGCTVKGGGFATGPLTGIVSNPSEEGQPALVQLAPVS